MRPRLSRALLDTIRRERGGVVDVPADALLDLPERAVQFGTGALLRGLVDDFLHRANAGGSFGGRVVAIASTGSTRDRALSEQDGLYTLVVEGIERGERVQECRIVSSLSRALSAPSEWPAVLQLARQPELDFVFSNTTEIGIAADEQSGFDDAPPRSFPAKLTRFLFERARAFDFDAHRGVVVLPCELIEGNGDRLRDIVLSIAARWQLGDAFAAWLASAVPFCNTLVDRIVPGAPSADDRARLAAQLGYDDEMLTCCEPFRLLAIEGDDVLAARMPWAAADAGIVIAPDITPYRLRKVALLNGAHSLLAPMALQLGHETVRDAISDPLLEQFVRTAMLDEIAPVLGVDGAEEFAEAVLDRFRNPFIRHALIDITLQATMKVRVRVVPSIRRYIETRGAVPQALACGLAAFLLYMQGRVQRDRRTMGQPVPADDQGASLASLWGQSGDDAPATETLVAMALADASLWGGDLRGLPGLEEAVCTHLERMRTEGVGAALENVLHLESSKSASHH